LGIPAALLNDDRLGRALEILAVHSETLRGTLAARAIERFGIDAGRLHVDLTALRVCGAYEGSALIAKGWAQGHGVARQVRALQASAADGVSVYVRPEPGNAAEVSLIAQSLERRRELSGPGGLLILDSACGHPKTLCEIARADLRFIVALRAQTGFRERFLADVGHAGLSALRYVSQREQSLPTELHTTYRRALRSERRSGLMPEALVPTRHSRRPGLSAALRARSKKDVHAHGERSGEALAESGIDLKRGVRAVAHVPELDQDCRLGREVECGEVVALVVAVRSCVRGNREQAACEDRIVDGMRELK
jgi:hypothetical protein